MQRHASLSNINGINLILMGYGWWSTTEPLFCSDIITSILFLFKKNRLFCSLLESLPILQLCMFNTQVECCGRVLNPPTDTTCGGETARPISGRRPKDFAFKTIPSSLLIKPSSIAGAGLAVWTKQCLNKGLMLGPYQGVRVDWEMAAHKSGYSWEVSGTLIRKQKC